MKQDSNEIVLTYLEHCAMDMAARDVLITSVASRDSTDDFGDPEPGMPTFKRLIKRGLIGITEEDDDGMFTPSFYLTDEGEAVYSDLGSWAF